MKIMNQLLHQIADASLSHEARARLRCQLAKEFEDSGNYEGAREAMGEIWSRVGERPSVEGLERQTAAEVLLRSGVVTGQLGSVKQVETAQETAKNLITESISIFETLEELKKIAEARIELAQCYWREGAYDEARVMLAEALGRLGDADGKLKAIALYRSAIVAKLSSRHNDALRYYNEAALFFEEITNDALRGKFHNGFANLLACLGQTEWRSDYTDRAFIEYAAASFHFERAGQARHHACVENNLGYLFCTINKFAEAHNHLDRAQAIFTSLRDSVHLAQVDETRARVYLAEGRVGDAEKLARAAVGVLERGGEQSLLAEALTTQGTALARGGQFERAGEVLLRAADVAEAAGDVEGAGQAALTLIEELGERLALQDLGASFERADALLAHSRHPGNRNRLYSCARLVLCIIGVLPEPDTWENFSFRDAVRRYEGRLVEGALRDSGGVVSRAAQLLGLTRQNLDSMLHRRHRRLLPLRTPAAPRRRSLMFREPHDAAATRSVHILHAEDDALVASGVREALREEGWRVSTYADGTSALGEIEGPEPYDLFIIDKQLPGVDGLELVYRTRSLPHRQNVPVIVLSASSDAKRAARRAGASAFLRKPEDMPALVETIARLLARKTKQG